MYAYEPSGFVGMELRQARAASSRGESNQTLPEFVCAAQPSSSAMRAASGGCEPSAAVGKNWRMPHTSV